MKRAVSFLFFTLLFNSLLYYCYFSYAVFHAKLEAMLAIASINQKSIGDIVRIAVNKPEKYASDEIWYRHNLYDVVKRESVNDTNYLYLLEDKDEEELLKDNAACFNNDSGICIMDDFKIPHPARSNCLPDCNYLVPLRLSQRPLLFRTNSRTPEARYTINRYAADVPTPPPKSTVIYS